jgi:uncharacterized protein (DUF983 family)
MNWRRRLYFECPVCGYKSKYARQIKYGLRNSEFKCENCNAIVIAKRSLLLDLLLGVILGVIFGGLAYTAFVSFLSAYSPVVSIVVVAPFMIVATYYVFGPLYGKWTYRWTSVEHPKA